MSARRAAGMVWFVGAGPGDPDLITVKGRDLLARADLILYAGSLVPPAMLEGARQGARLKDSSALTLEETHALLSGAAWAGETAVRLHTGDGSLFGAMREQKILLDAEGIPNAVVPGVSAAFAAAAAAGVSFTVPGAAQSLIFARLHGRTPVPQGQRVRDYARHGGSMAVYLAAGDPERLAAELRAGGLPEQTPVVVAGRVGQPEQRLERGVLADLARILSRECFARQTIVLILPGESLPGSPSRLYAGDFSHGYRNGTGPPAAGR
ncbi:MAG: precorrin-4 C(11)-methyltransferase [Desulfovibrio sp.]|jgi:precorrin-4/cobalt-precorrin-4 C11-methyltransferase|nr:precorrin-4 C(11)-methyltransferase [Desulfovibrio sp.]